MIYRREVMASPLGRRVLRDTCLPSGRLAPTAATPLLITSFWRVHGERGAVVRVASPTFRFSVWQAILTRARAKQRWRSRATNRAPRTGRSGAGEGHSVGRSGDLRGRRRVDFDVRSHPETEVNR